MSQFKVQTKQMRQQGSALYECKRRLDWLASDVAAVRQKLPANIGSRANIDASLRTIKKRIEKQQDIMAEMHTCLLNACEFYENTENTLTGKAGGKSLLDRLKGAGVKMVSKAGVAGTLIGTFLDTPKGSLLEQALHLGKAVSKSGEAIAKWSKIATESGKLARISGKAAQKSFLSKSFGLQKYTASPSKAAAWSTRFKNNFYKEDWTDDILPKSGWKIAGVTFTAALCGISNYQEYHSGEISSSRAVAETVTETAVSLVSGALTKAAVGAAVIAAAPAAPAIIVGAAVVGATVLIDKGFEAITGKGATEFISDAILDTAEAVIPHAVNAVKTGIEKIACGWKTIFGL